MARPKNPAQALVPDIALDEARIRAEQNLVARLTDEDAERRAQLEAQFADGLPWHPAHYEAEIRRELRAGCEAFLRAGRLLLVARECAAHGEWGEMLGRLGIERTQAFRMIEAARRVAGLPNVARAQHLIAAAGSQSKLIALLSLPEDELEELAETGATGGLSTDDVAIMTRDQLRAAVRELRADAEAKDRVLQDKEARISKLDVALQRARELPPSEREQRRQQLRQQILGDIDTAANSLLLEIERYAVALANANVAVNELGQHSVGMSEAVNHKVAALFQHVIDVTLANEALPRFDAMLPPSVVADLGRGDAGL
ncbi:MAG: hypothetical protein U0973_11595 [Xanthomonadaceae bacterium]|nr:hypothetical protein [Xanthomonadaceae bacterium]